MAAEVYKVLWVAGGCWGVWGPLSGWWLLRYMRSSGWLVTAEVYEVLWLAGDCWGPSSMCPNVISNCGFDCVQAGRVSIIFSCDQAALQMVFSVRLSVCLSVRLSVRLSHLFDYVPVIVSSWNFQEILPMTKVRSMQKIKVRGQRSRSQRSQPNLTVSGL